MTYGEMVRATGQAVGARDGARDALAERIRGIVRDTIETCALARVEVAGYVIEARTVEQDCSQWGDRTEYPGRRETHLLVVRGPERDLARSFGKIDLTFFDGRNMQYSRNSVTCGDAIVRPATVAMLRTIAAALPEVVARAHAERQARMTEQTRVATDANAGLDGPVC